VWALSAHTKETPPASHRRAGWMLSAVRRGVARGAVVGLLLWPTVVGLLLRSTLIGLLLRRAAVIGLPLWRVGIVAVKPAVDVADIPDAAANRRQ